MDFDDRQSISSMSSMSRRFERPGSDIKKTGYLKKFKTMKKKFFVLRSTSSSGPARLEYYDNEKKFKSNAQPKRSIHLHTCFNINKKSESRHGKHGHGIVLYTNEECFTVLTESEEDQEAWLSIMLEFQNEYLPDGDMHKEHYEHVWQVVLQPRGLGQGKGSKGQYRLCLNNTTISLVKANSTQPQYAIQLVTVRSVAHNECSIRLEVGKVAPTGEGEFWFTVEDANVAKDMHATLLHYMNTVKDPSLRKEQQPSSQFRQRRGSHSSVDRPCIGSDSMSFSYSTDRRWPNKPEQRPVSYYPASSNWQGDMNSPSSPNYPMDHFQGAHRPRSNTAESRASRTSSHSYHDDASSNPDFMMGYNGDQMDMTNSHCSYVPADMSPPPSPGGLDEEMNAYMQMDMEKNRQQGGPSGGSAAPTQASSYFSMAPPSHGHAQKGEVSPLVPEIPTAGYMSMLPHHGPPTTHMSAPIPIHTHSYSEPHHSTPLPTVREGGSNEGYLPMDIPNSPASSTGVLKPDPAKCMLSDDMTGLPPRTYSLGSKPVGKKYAGYVEMGPRKGGAGNDMSRATSAPHIIHNLKGRRERDHMTDSPTPSASPLSTSVKSDDSDSFMEYMPMRPRTASDSFNYRTRTSSFGKLQQTCRPRSSSHGQGTRPFIKFNKLSVEPSRISQDPLQRTSRESSLHGSFDSLRVSNESLRRMSQEMRQPSGSNASDYAEMRGTPSPQMKNMKPEMDGYVNMQVGAPGRKSSPHRMRTDSSGSGRRPDIKASSSERLHQQPHLQQIDDYTEMTPGNAVRGGGNGESYVNVDYGGPRHSFSNETKPSTSARQQDSYMSMEPDSKNKSDGGRSLSMENVDTYVIYDPSHGANKPRTGSLGSKDKKITKPGSTRKSSSASMSSSSPSSSGTIHPTQSASTSTRTGGSSDSIRKASRQSSMEKYGSLGKDFRKKSGSTGSRPNSAKGSFGAAVGGAGLMPMRKNAGPKIPIDEPNDEYVEFSPTATLDTEPHHGQSSYSHSAQSHPSLPISNSGRSGPFASSGSFGTSRSPNPASSPANDDSYTLYDPAPMAKSSHHHQQHSYHHPPTKPGHSSSSVSHAKQVAAKEDPQYVGFEPGVIPSAQPSFPTSSSAHLRPVEAKDAPEYVGFEPGVIPPATLGTSPSAQRRQSSPQDEYVGYQPGVPSYPSASQPSKLISPSSAISYIQGSPVTQTSGISKDKQQGHKQHHTSVDPGQKLTKADTYSGSSGSHLSPSSSLTFEPSRQSCGLPSPSSPRNSRSPSLPVSSSSSTAQSSVTAVPKAVVPDTSEYLSYNPAVPAIPSVTSKENTAPDMVKAVCLIEGSTAPPLPQLSVNVGGGKDVGSKNGPSTPAGSDNSKSQQNRQQQQQQQIQQQRQQEKQQKPQQQQQHPQGYHRQMSAPASSSSKPTPLPQECQLQPPSPQSTASPTSTEGTRSKHPSTSSLVESPSPTGTSTTRHKHWSGSSNSSQKSRRISSDSEKPLRKGNKSDSNSSLNSSGSKGKRRMPSGEKSPGGSAEKSPLSPSRGSGEFFCGEASQSTGKSLESKIIQVEAKIRHSLGDMTGVVGVVNKEGQGHHGLIRPGSTPCMQNLDPAPDPGSRSAGDTPNPNSRTGGLQFPAGPRSRHSLSDLGAYQQMNFSSSGLSPLGSETSTSTGNGSGRGNGNGGGGGGSSSGSGESCGSSTDPPPKPLNYVKLDLSCPEGQGDADGKSPRVKSRNSSDADEKQPPLSYAQIDFVKSQNLNKVLAMGSTGDNSYGKS